MCSSPYWQVGQSWFREKLSPANREQRLSRWADFAKNCLLRIGSKVLPRFREKYRALGRQKNGVQHATAIYPIPRYTRPRYIGLTLYIATFGCWLMHYEDSVWPNNEHKQVIYLDQLNVQRYSWIKRQPWKDQSILDVSVDDASYYRRLKFGDQRVYVCVCVYNKNPCAWILWHWSSKG